MKPPGFKLAKLVLLVFLAAANSEGLSIPVLLHSWSTLLQPLAQLSRSPCTHKFRHSPSTGLCVHVAEEEGLPWCALSLVPVVSGHPSEVRTLPQCFGYGLDAPPNPWWSTGQPGREETRAAAAGEFPKLTLSVFFFLRKSSCSILPLHTRKGLSSHTAQLSS